MCARASDALHCSMPALTAWCSSMARWRAARAPSRERAAWWRTRCISTAAHARLSSRSFIAADADANAGAIARRSSAASSNSPAASRRRSRACSSSTRGATFGARRARCLSERRARRSSASRSPCDRLSARRWARTELCNEVHSAANCVVLRRGICAWIGCARRVHNEFCDSPVH